MSNIYSAKTSLFWSFLIQFSFQFVGFFVSIILARLLTPAEFGIIGMIAVFLNIGRTFVDGGLAASLIRTKEANDEDFSTVFWINICIGLIIYVSLFLSAPYIASFFNEPILVSALRIYGVSLILGSLSVVHATIYRKYMNFKVQFYIMTLALVLSGGASITMALNGFGLMSLVWKEIIFNGVISLTYWTYSNWKPSFTFNRSKFKYHFSFGSKLLMNDVITKFFQDYYKLLIGKYVNTYQLGLFTRSKSLEELPNGIVFSTINRVLFPMMSAQQEDEEKLVDSYRKIIRIVFFFMIPLSFFLILAAKELVLILLTQKWIEIVPYFQILILGGIFLPLSSYLQSLIKVKGRSDLILKITIAEICLLIIGTFFLFKYGIYGLLWVLVIVSILKSLITGVVTAKIMSYSLKNQMLDLTYSLMYGVISFVMCYILFSSFDFSNNEIILFTVKFTLFIISYTIIAFTFNSKALTDLKFAIGNLIKK